MPPGPPAAAGGPGAPPRPAEPPKPTETVDEVLNKYRPGNRRPRSAAEDPVPGDDRDGHARNIAAGFPGSGGGEAARVVRLEIQSQPQPQSWGASGTAVWGGRGGGRGMQGFQAQQVRRRADLGAPLSMAQRYQNLTANRYDTNQDRNTIVLVGHT